MNKLVIVILSVILLVVNAVFSHAAEPKMDVRLELEVPTRGSYAIKCPLCAQTQGLQGNSFRMYGVELDHLESVYDAEKKDYVFKSVGPKYPGHYLYRCQHGHNLWVPMDKSSNSVIQSF